MQPTAEIIGRACVAPGARDVTELFRLLKDGRCTVTEVPRERWDHARYWHPLVGTPGKTYTFAAGIVEDIFDSDPDIFGISHREASYLDPQQRVILELTWRALEDANIDPSSLRGGNVGVFIGASSLDHANLTVEDPAAAGPYFMSGNTLSVVSNRISHIFGLHGPSLTVDTACSSSLVALDQAMKAMAAGTIDTAIVGGVNVLSHPLPFVGFAQARMLSPEGLCRPYDNDGAGYVRAEGGAVLILRRTDLARAHKDRSHATIVATGSNAAGRTNGISLPSREAQAALLSEVYDGNDIDVAKLAFIEGHGTGTKVGDPAEIWSIGNVIGQRRSGPIVVGSIKSNIGHAEPASGVLGLVKAMLALEHDYLPATLHFRTPNREIDFDGLNVHVASEGLELLRSGQSRLAGINSFGFGGANAHVVISDPILPKPGPAAAPSESSAFMISAHSQESLQQLVASYAAQMDGAAVARKHGLCASAGANRATLRHRLVVPSQDPTVVRGTLQTYLSGADITPAAAGEAQHAGPVAFVFSGNGSQWAGMGVSACSNIHFRRQFEAISAMFQPHLDYDLAELLVDERLESLLDDTTLAQPLLFAIQAALSDTLVKLGIRPAVVFGHSVGEIAAAYAAGAISLIDAVTIIARRSFYQAKLAGRGRMAAALMTAAEAEDFAQRLGLKDLTVAAYNAPNSITVSGPVEDVRAFHDAARQSGRSVTILALDYAFHHPMIDEVCDAFLKDVPPLSLNTVRVPFISSVTGREMAGPDLDAHYWWRNLREPVAFETAARAATVHGASVFIEIGPRPVLRSYLTETFKDCSYSATVIPTLDKTRSGRNSPDPVAEVVSRALVAGAAIDRDEVLGQRNPSVEHPILPFLRKPFEPARTSDAVDLYGRRANGGRLVGWRVDPNGSSWKNHIDAHLYPDLAEHVIEGRAVLPGSGLLEIALGAAQEFYHADNVEILDLEILQPLELSQARIATVSTVISPETGGIEIRSRERLSDDDWAIHAVGRCRVAPQPEDSASMILPSKAAGDPIVPDRAYHIAKRFGLEYGPCFQLLKEARWLDEHTVAITLKAPQGRGNPHVTYALHPILLDAAFHGLVAMFGDLTGDYHGAPYIPVRFGRTQIVRSGAAAQKAIIQIERFSPHSLKAVVRLFDEDGHLVAALHDCRFKRTYLRQHKTIDQVTCHYQALPLLIDRAAPSLTPPAVVSGVGDMGAGAVTDGATYMVRASVYRACFDIAERLATDRRIEWLQLPEDDVFRSFLTHCMQALESADLAMSDDFGWTIAEHCELPKLTEILREIVREAPDRTAEAVAIHDAYLAALRRLDTGGSPRMLHADTSDGKDSSYVSAATRLHMEQHSPAATARAELVLEAVSKAVGELAKLGRRPYVVELGTTAPALSGRIARLISEHAGRLIIFDRRDDVVEALKLQFDDQPNVDIRAMEGLARTMRPDIIVSADHGLYKAVLSSTELREFLRTSVRAGTNFLGLFNAPDYVADFAFGLTAGHLPVASGPKSKIGSLPGAGGWRQLMTQLGAQATIQVIDRPSGSLLLLSAGPTSAVDEIAETKSPPRRPLVLICDADSAAGLPEDFDRSDLFIVGEGKATESVVLEAINRASEIDAPVVYVAATERSSEALQKDIGLLGLLAETWSRKEDHQGTFMPQLVILAKDAAPCTPDKSHQAKVTTSPAGAGVWAFARVLRNEYPFLTVLTIDVDVSTGWSDTAFSAIETATTGQADTQEWIVGRETGALSEICAASGPFPKIQEQTNNFAAATIRQRVPSQVSSLEWEEMPLPQPRPGEVVIAVAATGVNFRDVMWAMGVLPEEALEDGFAGATLGMECSGQIVAVGDGVEHIQIGDPVMAFAPSAFSTHVAVDARAVVKLPRNIATVAAATLPVTFLTAYYALAELAKLKPGETVLIHGGAGGVGLAALQIAKHIGATVISTAGTAEKRDFLRFLGADHVFDSRSLRFEKEVHKLTKGHGVDVVLNSLASDAMERSLELLKPFGRFLELGKRDYYANSKIGLRPFRRNLSYFGIDADQLLSSEPGLIKRLLNELCALFEAGVLRPLPYRHFAFDEIGDAFRLMQASGHIGKILVSPPRPGVDHVAVRAAPIKIDPQGMHLVVGGIAGFGLAAANWLVFHGARNITLCSRSGKADEETSRLVDRWRRQGVTVHLQACDVTVEEDVDAMLRHLRETAPLRTVIHAAMVLDDALISNLTPERNRPVIDVKAYGADILDKLTRQDALDNFILFSSATTLVGNPGQANYVAANGYLEGLAQARRTNGLPALAVAFGAISDAGVLTRDGGQALAQWLGNSTMHAHEALQYLEEYMSMDPGTPDAAHVVIANMDWKAINSLPISKTTLLKPILQARRNEVGTLETGVADVATLIRGKSAKEAEEILYQIVAEEIAAVLRVPVASVSRDKVLKDIGLDSLMAIELGLSFQARTGHDMPLNGVSDSTTVGEIVAKLYRRIRKSDEVAEITDNIDDLTILAERHREQTPAGSLQEVRMKRAAK